MSNGNLYNIREISRTIKERMKEHIGACRLAERGRSAVAKQAWEDGHIIAWDGIEIVDMEERILERTKAGYTHKFGTITVIAKQR